MHARSDVTGAGALRLRRFSSCFISRAPSDFLMPTRRAARHALRSSANSSHNSVLIEKSFKDVLQTSLYLSFGLPLFLAPVESSQRRTFLGMRSLTWGCDIH